MDKMSNSAAEMNNYALSVELDQKEIKNCKVILGAGVGDGFNHIIELHVMKYNKRNVKIKHKHKTYGMETYFKKSSSKGQSILGSVWFMKKKADRT